MRQEIHSENNIDSNGNPTGGFARGIGIEIQWQNGPLGFGTERTESNGAFVEGAIEAALQRLRFFQEATSGKFACRQNALAITKLEEALMWLDNRTGERIHRGVEGTHQP